MNERDPGWAVKLQRVAARKRWQTILIGSIGRSNRGGRDEDVELPFGRKGDGDDQE